MYSGNNHSSHSTSLQVTCIYSSDCTKNQLSASSMMIMCLMVYNVYLYVSVLCDWVHSVNLSHRPLSHRNLSHRPLSQKALKPQALEPQSPRATKPLSHRPLSHRPLSHKALEPQSLCTQLLGYKENPTVLDRVPMSTEGKLSRIQRGWF